MEALRAELEDKGAAFKLSIARNTLAVETWSAAGYPRKGPISDEYERIMGAHSAVHREYWDVRDRIRDLTMPQQHSPAKPLPSSLPQSKHGIGHAPQLASSLCVPCHPGRLPMQNSTRPPTTHAEAGKGELEQPLLSAVY